MSVLYGVFFYIFVSTNKTTPLNIWDAVCPTKPGPRPELAAHMTVHMIVQMTVQMTVYKTVHMTVHMTVHLAVHMTVHWAVYMTVHMTVHMTVQSITLKYKAFGQEYNTPFNY